MEKKWRIDGWVDCHCHLTDPRILPFRDEMVKRAKAQGIHTFIAGGLGPEDWAAQEEYSAKLNLWPVFGLHPYWVVGHSREEFAAAFRELEQSLPNAIALGEIGLDFRGKISQGQDAWQREAFHQLWDLGIRQRKVMVLHLVRAHGEKPFPATPRPAVVHAFHAGPEIARKYLDQGFFLSVGGGLLGAKAEALAEAVAYMPLEQLLVESDSPDQAPPAYGERNEPASILLVAARVAGIKGLETEDVLRAVNGNLRRLFEEVE